MEKVKFVMVIKSQTFFVLEITNIAQLSSKSFLASSNN